MHEIILGIFVGIFSVLLLFCIHTKIEQNISKKFFSEKINKQTLIIRLEKDSVNLERYLSWMMKNYCFMTNEDVIILLDCGADEDSIKVAKKVAEIYDAVIFADKDCDVKDVLHFQAPTNCKKTDDNI